MLTLPPPDVALNHALPLDVALTLLAIAGMMTVVQLIIITVELGALRRDVLTLLRTTSALNNAVNPWAGEDEPTEPGRHHPPRFKRRRHISQWIVQLAQRRKYKRPHSD